MRKVKQITCLVIIFLFALFLVPHQADAASTKTKNKKAKAAYVKLLSKSTIGWGSGKCNTKNLKYSYMDINGDGVSELLLYNMEASHADGWNRIYAYVGGKAKSLGAFTDIEICKNKNFFTDTYSNHGVTRTKYYRLKSNGKKVLLAEYTSSYGGYPHGAKGQVMKKKDATYGYMIYYYNFKVNGKTTTYKKCMQVVNSLKKKAKYNKISWKYK